MFKSKDLVQWEYCHSFLEDDKFCALGDDGACPYFLPLGDKHVLLHFSHMSGGMYILGTYDKENLKFHAESGGAFNANSWMAGGVHAPSAYPDGQGNVYAIFNVNFGYQNGSENQIMSLPRKLSLGQNGELLQIPSGDYASLRYHSVSEKDIMISANTEVILNQVQGKALEIEMTVDRFEPKKAGFFTPDNLLPMFELRVLRSTDAREYTSIRFYRNRGKMNWQVFPDMDWASASNSILEVDVSNATLSPNVAIHPAERQEFYLSPDEPVKLHVFVDKSIVEVFAGDKKCISVRTYPSLEDSVGVSVLSKGVPAVISYEAWNMNSIYRD